MLPLQYVVGDIAKTTLVAIATEVVLYMCCQHLPIWCFLAHFRHVFARFPRLDSQDIHLVNFLQCSALGFQEEKVHSQGCNCAAAGKHVSVSKVNGRGDEGGEEGEKEIPDPVRGGGHCHTLRSIAGGIQLAVCCPNHRAPCACEGRYEQACKDDHGGSGFGGCSGICPVQSEMPDRRKDQEAHAHGRMSQVNDSALRVLLTHPSTTQDETLPTTKAVNEPESGECTYNIDRS
jgi:hypothetical protein